MALYSDSQKPTQKETRISLSVPIQKLWNAYKDYQILKRESKYARYKELVGDYRQED